MRFFSFWGNFRVEIIKRKTTTNHPVSWKPPKLVWCYLATAVPSPFILAHSSSPLKLNEAERALGIYMQNKGRGRLNGTVQRVYVEPQQQQQVPGRLQKKRASPLHFSFSTNSPEKQVKQNKQKRKNKVSKPSRQTLSVWFGENEWKWDIKHCFTDNRVLQEVSFWVRVSISRNLSYTQDFNVFREIENMWSLKRATYSELLKHNLEKHNILYIWH